jgi:hydrogenase expression/formation protein HypE
MFMLAEDGEKLVECMNEQGIPAVMIGKLTDNNDKILRNGEEVRYIDRPAPDEIMKIFESTDV